MKAIRRYSLQVDADLARMASEASDIPAVIVGGQPYPGMIFDVHLLVPEDRSKKRYWCSRTSKIGGEQPE